MYRLTNSRTGEVTLLESLPRSYEFQYLQDEIRLENSLLGAERLFVNGELRSQRRFSLFSSRHEWENNGNNFALAIRVGFTKGVHCTLIVDGTEIEEQTLVVDNQAEELPTKKDQAHEEPTQHPIGSRDELDASDPDDLGSTLTRLRRNLANGFRLSTLRDTSPSQYSSSVDQATAITLALVGVTLLLGFLTNQRPWDTDLSYVLDSYAIYLLTTLCFSYVASRFIARELTLTNVYIMMTSAFIWPYTYLSILSWSDQLSMYSLFALTSNDILHWKSIATGAIVYSLFLSAQRLVQKGLLKKMTAAILYSTVVIAPLLYKGFGSPIHEYHDYSQYLEQLERIGQEQTYYRQFDLMSDLTSSLRTHRPGETDLYFVGFAGYGGQDVFMKEVRQAQEAVDETLGAEGRSSILVNNPKTVDEVPLANTSNLSWLIQHIGRSIDREEDVLFLYLTSHGGDNHTLAVDLVPLDMKSLDPNTLKGILDASEIKWRIIIISACYSGGFIEPLRDAYSIVMTASASDRVSHGCSDKNDYTDFGRAVFNDELPKGHSLEDTFRRVIARINRSERARNVIESRPQLAVGSEIARKLRQSGL